jgi:hypothetical protein
MDYAKGEYAKVKRQLGKFIINDIRIRLSENGSTALKQYISRTIHHGKPLG